MGHGVCSERVYNLVGKICPGRVINFQFKVLCYPGEGKTEARDTPGYKEIFLNSYMQDGTL